MRPSSGLDDAFPYLFLWQYLTQSQEDTFNLTAWVLTPAPVLTHSMTSGESLKSSATEPT